MRQDLSFCFFSSHVNPQTGGGAVSQQAHLDLNFHKSQGDSTAIHLFLAQNNGPKPEHPSVQSSTQHEKQGKLVCHELHVTAAKYLQVPRLASFKLVEVTLHYTSVRSIDMPTGPTMGKSRSTLDFWSVRVLNALVVGIQALSAKNTL